MPSPVLLALAATVPVGHTTAGWMWEQAGVNSATDLRLGDMERVIVFIDERLTARANSIQTEVRSDSRPYLWPFSDLVAANLYPDQSVQEREEIAEGQMTQAVEALRAYVIGDILQQAGDERNIRFLGDLKNAAVKGEAKTALNALRDDVRGALANFGLTKNTVQSQNLTLLTHATAPVLTEWAALETD